MDVVLVLLSQLTVVQALTFQLLLFLLVQAVVLLLLQAVVAHVVVALWGAASVVVADAVSLADAVCEAAFHAAVATS